MTIAWGYKLYCMIYFLRRNKQGFWNVVFMNFFRKGFPVLLFLLLHVFFPFPGHVCVFDTCIYPELLLSRQPALFSSLRVVIAYLPRKFPHSIFGFDIFILTYLHSFSVCSGAGILSSFPDVEHASAGPSPSSSHVNVVHGIFFFFFFFHLHLTQSSNACFRCFFTYT
ncbi:hypothetical protein I7I48_05803 [Histoplasma ohiense]|nr:hypothetical protein I7I48_05803 [Histoplasma ohiense (nom. inval.)]